MNMVLAPAKIGPQDIIEFSAEEIVMIAGDLSVLTAPQRVAYYRAVCESVGLNPLTRPFDYINLNGKLTLYAKKDATDQLRALHTISIDKIERAIIPGSDVLTVTAYGHNLGGRADASIGAVSVRGLSGEPYANAMMKAETKAKRRLTLSLAGLGFLDENEVGSIPGAITVKVTEEGEIDQAAPQKPSTLDEALSRPLAAEAPAAESSGSPETVLPSPETAPAASPAVDAPESAPEAPVQTGLTMDELKDLMKEKHVFAPTVAAAMRVVIEDAPKLVADLTDDQRLVVWFKVMADIT